MPTESVSVIIPTRNRPALLARALRSVTNQTVPPDEVVVVIDGPDVQTQELLAGFASLRIRTIASAVAVGGCNARNLGISAAKGKWIAFFDDDDEWLPDKLERQSDVALHSSHEYPIVCSQVIRRTPSGDYLMSRRAPGRAETPAQYLFCRQTVLPGEACLQTSNLLMPQSLLQKVSFRPGQRRGQDTDLLLRASQIPGVGLVFVPRPLSIYFCEDSRPAFSNTVDWKYLLAWASENRRLFTPSEYSGALLNFVGAEAERMADSSAVWVLLREAFRNGCPTMTQLLLFASMFAIPKPLRRWLRDKLRVRCDNAQRGKVSWQADCTCWRPEDLA